MSLGELILGIESSCDDTGVAVVGRHGNVLSSVVASQVEVHSQFGGVYPEFASRAHIGAILPAVAQALAQSGAKPADLRAIGVTRGPGLVGPLMVGLNTAAGLSLGWGVPLVGVNHLRGHIRSADLEEKRVTTPAVVLLVSGGHTILAYLPGNGEMRILGETRDDSVGEAYDKVGRLLGLGYPAGPLIDRLAAKGQATVAFPRPLLHNGYEFSFSGLKSAVARHLEGENRDSTENVAASFVAACMEVLLKKCRRALLELRPRCLVIVGGVSASPQLRDGAAALCKKSGVKLCLPPLKWSTDNAAMIALAAWDYLELDEPPGAVACPGLPFHTM